MFYNVFHASRVETVSDMPPAQWDVRPDLFCGLAVLLLLIMNQVYPVEASLETDMHL
jgi:hypothetical protein